MTTEGVRLQAGLWLQGERGRYQLERPLGEGGFGHAWAATAEDGTPVVVKQLRLQRMDDWKALELFEREAAVLASVAHPSIPRHLEFFTEGGTSLSVYVRVEGRSLQEHIDAGSVMDGATLTALLDALLEVLEYLHGLQPPVIHRDIKPANVIVDPHGRPHLVDFGAIKNHMREGSTTVGTFGYFPMEQMMGQSRPASDLYALGMTILVAATRVPPEDMPTSEQTGKVELPILASGLPPNTFVALGRMLEPIVGQRVQSASEVRAMLRDPGRALVPRGSTALAPVSRRDVTLANVCIATSGAAAAGIYLVFFDALSETVLVQVSALWIGPLLFGVALAILARQGVEHPKSKAAAIAGVGLFALIVFFFAIFPAL